MPVAVEEDLVKTVGSAIRGSTFRAWSRSIVDVK